MAPYCHGDSLSFLPNVFPKKRLSMRLTVKEIAAYRWPDRADTIVFDDDIAGFGLRSREGRMSWVFQYAIGGHGGRVTRRIKIGDYPALSPTLARKEAETLHAKVHLHGDPGARTPQEPF